MELKLAEKLEQICENMGIDCSIYSNYSGRFMYGKTTTGIVIPSIGLLISAIIMNAHYLIDDNGDPLFDFIDNFKTDNMGRDIIVY